jgi:SanA protein
MTLLKKIALISTSIFIGAIFLIMVSDFTVNRAAKDKVYLAAEEVPFNRVGLFLGTGKYLSNGHINLYYKHRIDAAVKLYKANKVDFILVSGDNSSREYDEPSTIKEDLINAGVPPSKIYLDYAGFRTLDSVVRCREIFGQDRITVISQEFHNERAIYIAQKNDIDAVGFNAKDVSVNYGFKTQLREKLARVKMMLDLIIGVEPKFLGEKVRIE